MAVEINSSCRLAAPALVAAALFLAGAVAAAATGIKSCDTFKDADAYNACLASFGPAVGAHEVHAAPAAVDEPREEKDEARRRRGRRPGEQARQQPVHAPKRQANGRMRIEIMPGR